MIVTIEGNIGAGKSTLIQELAQNARFDCHPEPIQEWTQSSKRLQDFYDNPQRHALGFQVDALVRFSEALDVTEGVTILQERSIFSSYYVFGTCHYELGNITDYDFETLTRLFSRCAQHRPTNGIVYLQVNPEEALERIRLRGRPEEQGITLEYLRRLGDLHDEVFVRNAAAFNIPIKVMTSDLGTPQLASEVAQFAQTLRPNISQGAAPCLIREVKTSVRWSDGW